MLAINVLMLRVRSHPFVSEHQPAGVRLSSPASVYNHHPLAGSAGSFEPDVLSKIPPSVLPLQASISHSRALQGPWKDLATPCYKALPQFYASKPLRQISYAFDSY